VLGVVSVFMVEYYWG